MLSFIFISYHLCSDIIDDAPVVTDPGVAATPQARDVDGAGSRV
jgi:hypothetical protein